MQAWNPFRKLTGFEWGLWLFSLAMVTLSFLFGGGHPLTLAASLIGVTALIFVAKGEVLGQILTVVFSLAYAAVSLRFRYYGEMITYLGMTAPIAVMSVVVFVQVVFRFIVKSSLPWSEELSRYLQVYITFFGTAYGIQTGAHLGIEAFTHLLPKGGRKVLAILVQIVSMLVCTLILKLGVDIVMSQMASGQVSPAMRIPMWVIYGAIPMGMAFCVIRYIVEIYHSVKNFNKPEDREVLE